MAGNGYDMEECLAAIDPGTLSYEEWLAVGQALHHEGYPSDTWREWSASDAARFDERDFERKWRGFGFESGAPVTGGTIVKMARDRGWTPRPSGHALAWDDVICADEKPLVDAAYVAGDVAEPLYKDGQGRHELAAYLDALFEPDEFVGYVTAYSEVEKDGCTKCIPADRGVYARTAGEIREALKGGMDSALGTVHDESGAWIRFNPLDGHGVGNANVAAFRHCLVESDETDPGTMKAIVEQLNLPVAAMVHSGSRSMHVIVKVDAHDADEYRSRVEKVYAVCEKNGIAVDKANKNPSRLSRMPGVTRGGNRQYLASLKSGADDYDEWEEWYAAETDELPDPVSVETLVTQGRPDMADELIAGVLRVGHKMLLSGPSKAGKSFELIELSICLSEGLPWLGFQCRQSRVLYVNLELDANSCMNRFADMYEALGIVPRHAADLDVWNLRGKAEPLSRLLPKMVRRGRKRGYEVIIVDPIYKVMTGDENSATDMAAFANNFDALALEVGCSVIYCHHHSKGYQEGKRSVDRASGSGVFARDPDAIVDMVELAPDEALVNRRVNARLCKLVADFMAWHGLGRDYKESVEAQKRAVAAFALSGAVEVLLRTKPGLERDLRAAYEASEGVRPTAWRIEGTLREFAAFKPISLWFDWPLHVPDPELSEAPEMGDVKAARASGRTVGSGGKGKKTKRDKVNDAIAEAVQSCSDDGVAPTKRNVLERMPAINGKKPTSTQIANWVRADATWCRWRLQADVLDGKTPGIIVSRGASEEGEDVW